MLVGDGAGDAAGTGADVGHEQLGGLGSGFTRGDGRRRFILGDALVGRSLGALLPGFAFRPSGRGKVVFRPCMLRHPFRHRRQQGQGIADQHLGLGARDQHAGANLHRDMAKSDLARDVLQRLALAAARDVGAQHIALLHRQRLLEIRVQLDAGKAGRFGQQPLRGQPRVLVALALEVAHRPIKGGLNGPDVVHYLTLHIKRHVKLTGLSFISEYCLVDLN